MADDDRAFLLKEYETLWTYAAQLDRERRQAVRFLLGALPGVPAAVFGVFAAVRAWSNSDSTPLTATAVAPWMLALLPFVYVVGWCYFMVLVTSRARAVEYNRKLNLIRKTLVDECGEFAQRMRHLDENFLNPCRPGYVGWWRTDFWYGVLVALANSAVAWALAFFWLSLHPATHSARSLIAAGAGFVPSLFFMMGVYVLYLSRQEFRARRHGGPRRAASNCTRRESRRA